MRLCDLDSGRIAVQILSGPHNCEIESTLSAEDNLSIFNQRLIYQCIPDNVQLLAQDKLSCR